MHNIGDQPRDPQSQGTQSPTVAADQVAEQAAKEEKVCKASAALGFKGAAATRLLAAMSGRTNASEPSQRLSQTPFPDALQGAANTRFIVATPDGGTGTSNLGLAVIETIGNGAGTTTGTVFGEVSITNSFGATKVYVVSVQGSIESMNSAAGTKTPFLIKSLG